MFGSTGSVLLIICFAADVVSLPFPIRGFMPKTNVVNHMQLDLDLHEVLKHMLTFYPQDGDDSANAADSSVLKLDLARRVYQLGGHAVRQAQVTVPPLVQEIKAGEYIFQRRPNDWTRSARLRVAAPKGSTELIVEYTTYQRPCIGGATDKSTTTHAYDTVVEVSAHCLDTETPLYTNPPPRRSSSLDPSTHFFNSTTLTTGRLLEYHVSSDTGDLEKPDPSKGRLGKALSVLHTFLTLAELSATAGGRMQGETEFESRRAFYGSGDYAHLFVMNTFDANVGRPLIDYRTLGHSVGSDIVRKIIVFMSIHGEVAHQIYKAVQFCDDINESECIAEACEDSAMHAWEKAAAYYAGSSWEDRLKSILLDGSAQDMCRIFGTCDSKGDALANKWIYKSFVDGQDHLGKGDCERLMVDRKRITQQMYVPLVQNLLRTAFAIETEPNVHRERAHGVFFAKWIQPIAQKCDPKVAKLIAENLDVDAARDATAKPMLSKFPTFKRSVEGLYPCLGITCLDVGGILAKEQMTNPGKDAKYVTDGEPCLDSSTNVDGSLETPPNANHAEQASIVVAPMAAVSAAALAYVH